jgi:MYXO-CTERM domain-containing protein
MLMRAFFSCAVLFLAAGAMPARADPSDWCGPNKAGDPPCNRPRAKSVPEFDPAAAGALATLLGGGALLLGRRRKP